MKDRNREISLMPEFDSEEAFDAYFAEETAATAPYRDTQGRLVLDDVKTCLKSLRRYLPGIQNSRILFSRGRLSICIFVRVKYPILKRSVLK